MAVNYRAVSTATLLLALLVLVAGPASARAEADSPYTKAQTYSGALRYLRVDLGYEVVERDADAAYLLFKYVPPGRDEARNGSIEVVESHERVKILVQLVKMPRYYETHIRDGLLSKLRAEYGDPPEEEKPEPPSEEPEEPDDGSDEDPPREAAPDAKQPPPGNTKRRRRRARR